MVRTVEPCRYKLGFGFSLTKIKRRKKKRKQGLDWRNCVNSIYGFNLIFGDLRTVASVDEHFVTLSSEVETQSLNPNYYCISSLRPSTPAPSPSSPSSPSSSSLSSSFTIHLPCSHGLDVLTGVGQARKQTKFYSLFRLEFDGQTSFIIPISLQSVTGTSYVTSTWVFCLFLFSFFWFYFLLDAGAGIFFFVIPSKKKKLVTIRVQTSRNVQRNVKAIFIFEDEGNILENHTCSIIPPPSHTQPHVNWWRKEIIFLMENS